jgi:[acyl-carrier-protein] S-malonyltransferase
MFDLVANCPEAEPVFAAAAGVLGLVASCRKPLPQTCSPTSQGRPVLHEALAAWSALGMVRPVRDVIAGYSIGELAARQRDGAVGRPSAKDCSPHPKQTYLSRSRTSGSGALTGLVID